MKKEQIEQRYDKFSKGLIENLSQGNPDKPIKEIMLEAGFAKSTTFCEVIKKKGVQERLEEVIGKLDEKRELIIDRITLDKIEDSSAKDLAHIFDILTKNQQLLTGGDTGRNKIDLNIKKYEELSDEELRERIKGHIGSPGEEEGEELS